MSKGRRSRPKRKKTAVQKAAAKRHANFKKTRVQTFGGTRKRYSVKEANKIDKALGKGSFARVTKGAADPRNRAPSTEGVKVGPMKEEFTTPLGGMSYSQFEGAMKSNPFAPGADKGVSFSDAVRATRGGGLGISRPSTGGFGGTINRKLETPKDYVAFNPLKLLRSDPNTEIPAGGGNKIPSATKRELEIHNFQRQLEGLPPVKKLPDQSSLSGGDMVAAATSGGLTGVGATPVGPIGGVKSPESFGYPSQEAVDRATGTTTGGLNFGLSKQESDRLGRVFRDGPSPRMLSQGGDLRFSDMFEAAGPGANLTKGINFVKNKIPLVNRFVPDMKINSVAEEAQRQYLGFNPNLPANVLKQQERRSPNNNRTVYGTQSLFEDQPYYQPVQNAPAATTPIQQSGVDPNRLLQIQQQAYAQAFNPMVVGGYNPTFRFGASSPTIDYSSYFNY